MKKLICLIIIAILTLSLASCGNNAVSQDDNTSSPAESVVSASESAADIASKILTGVDFGDELEQTDNEITFQKYGIDGTIIKDAARYAGSGATADEVAVFICNDEAGVETVKQAIEDRIAYLKDGYSSYGPDEVPKIEGCYFTSEDLTVIFCISNSSNDDVDFILSK